ncbi:hypothetical protein [Paenibacillus harenae]|uniref:Uncharacterized protein n=1 Tax=Paenibacillus harenae TaxID=306543 RepID=A0ABT9U1H6_PAEHA|nr:hypothetical protein [Paenibacillus harenae]MDQ0112540.1 hypothetical protein [Paenibacillus harenae]
MELFRFKTTQKSESYCINIVSYMIEEFGINEEEAVGRINNMWGGIDWNDDIESENYDSRYHELPRDWAYIIYFGHESQWWRRDKSELTPRPYK